MKSPCPSRTCFKFDGQPFPGSKFFGEGQDRSIWLIAISLEVVQMVVDDIIWAVIDSGCIDLAV